MDLETLHRSTAPAAQPAICVTVTPRPKPTPPLPAKWKGCEAFRDGLEDALAAIGVLQASETNSGYWTAVGYGCPDAAGDRMIARIRFGLLGVDDPAAHPCPATSVKVAKALRLRGLAAHQEGQQISVMAHFAWAGSS